VQISSLMVGMWRCKDPRFLVLGTSWRTVISFTTRPLYPRGKIPRYPMYRRLRGPQNRSGRYEEAKIPHPTWTRNPTLKYNVETKVLEQLSCYNDELQAGRSWFDSRKRQEMFIYSIESRLVLRDHSASCPVSGEGLSPGIQ
jgi:hypothetical protein